MQPINYRIIEEPCDGEILRFILCEDWLGLATADYGHFLGLKNFSVGGVLACLRIESPPSEWPWVQASNGRLSRMLPLDRIPDMHHRIREFQARRDLIIEAGARVKERLRTDTPASRPVEEAPEVSSDPVPKEPENEEPRETCPHAATWLTLQQVVDRTGLSMSFVNTAIHQIRDFDLAVLYGGSWRVNPDLIEVIEQANKDRCRSFGWGRIKKNSRELIAKLKNEAPIVYTSAKVFPNTPLGQAIKKAVEESKQMGEKAVESSAVRPDESAQPEVTNQIEESPVLPCSEVDEPRLLSSSGQMGSVGRAVESSGSHPDEELSSSQPNLIFLRTACRLLGDQLRLVQGVIEEMQGALA